MQLTAAVVIMTTLLSLAIETRSRAAAISFASVVLFHLAIQLGPHWLITNALAREFGAALSRAGRDPASSIQAMLAAGIVGWLLAAVVRSAFREDTNQNWDPDDPQRLRRMRSARRLA